jgi:N-acetylneuraminic acid mutarotase
MAAGPASAAAARSAVTRPTSSKAKVKAPAVKRLKPVVRYAVRHDTSPALRKMKPLKQLPRLPHNFKYKPLPLGIPPHVVTGTSRAAVGGKGAPIKALTQAGSAHPGVRDITAAVQRAATVTTGNMPSIEQNFEGVGNLNGVLPPDTNMAVGPNDVVQTVNFSFAVYDKQGNTLLGPETLSTLWQGFGGECDPAVDPAANGGDVVSLYDEQANRFIVTQLAYPQLELGSGGFHECIAISQTGDPTGAWYRYDFVFSSNTLNDYPKWGVWPDAYYMSNNDFLDGQTFTGVTVTAFDRAEMLAGQPASDVQFTIGSQYGSLLPGNAEGGALGFNPPSGAPDPYWMSCDAANGGPCTSDQLDEWDFHVDWTNPANSTFGNNGSPSTTLPVATFNSNLCNYGRDCIPQPGTTEGLDALSDRLMYQAAYRNLGNGTDAVVLNQTVNVSSNPTTNPQAGVRWYELTNTGSGWSVGQQGTYAPDANNRWMGSANIDASGDIGIGYSESSSTVFPSINVAGRLAGDPAGQLSQGEETLMAGSGSQTDPQARWGDYSAMQVDPTDGCTFWYTSEYLPSTSDDSWHTRVGSFMFPSCTAGAHGTLTGAVTDASTSNPIAGATVSIGTATTTTNSQGTYTLVLPTGSYTETISAYGYGTDTIDNVQVTNGGTTTENAALTPEPTVPVTGTITDGSGHGWPLHASIAIQGRPGGPVWTDPASGQYSVSLPANATYSLTVNTDVPGYQPVTDSLAVGSSGVTHNIAVPVNSTTCNAPGYAFNYGTPALSENFDDYTGDGGSTPPPGWTIQDNLGNGQVWAFNNPEGRGNLTGGSGNFAVLNSDQYGAGASQDSSLITPVLDLSGDANPVLQFHNDYFGFPNQTGEVDVSTDGGTTWTSVWQHTSDSVRGPDLETVPIPQAAGQSNVEVRFHFISSFGWWWEVDDVTVANRACQPTPGGLVVGQVTDANTGTPLNGATVTDTDNPSDKATTGPTADPAINNGYYWLFSSLTGSHTFTAARGSYQTGSQTVNVAANGSTKANFALGAGQLSITPGSITTSQVLGNTTSNTMTIKNTGTAPATVKLVQQGGSFQILKDRGAPLRLIRFSDDDPASPGAYTGVHGTAGSVNAGPPADPTWSNIASYPNGIMDNGADNLNGKEYSVGGLDSTFTVTAKGFVYDPTQNGWSPIADMPIARYGRPAVAGLNGKLYVIGGWDAAGAVTGETDVYDPSSNSWTTVAPDPTPIAAPGVAVANGDIYIIGGCADSNCTSSSTVEVYNPSTNSWSTAASYPHGNSWESCGGIDGKVYCAGGTDGTNTFTDAYVYDPGSDSWSPIANLPIDLWASAAGSANGLLVVSGGVTNGFNTVTNQGYAYDPTSNTWSAIPNAQFPVYRAAGSCGFYKIGGSTGGFAPQSTAEALSGLTTCGTTVIPWMSENPTTATIQPGQSVAVTVTLSATTADQVTQPGTYTGQVGFEQDTPYDVNPVDVTMNVTPPKSWGEIKGTLSGENCSQVTAPLRGVVYANQGKGTTQYTLPTSPAGAYQFWGPRGAWSLQASAANWIPVTTSASIKAGTVLTVNITLRPTTC